MRGGRPETAPAFFCGLMTETLRKGCEVLAKKKEMGIITCEGTGLRESSEGCFPEKRRINIMSKKILTLVLAAVLMIGVSVPAVSHAWYTMYVYTENGKSLNVRSEPRAGDNVLWTIPFGERVDVDYNLGNGWTALMAAGAYESVYVQTRFLVSEKPTRKPSGTTPSGNPSTNASTAKELNKIFRSYKRVNPYRITVRPVRASGWVNLRFAPSKETEVMATYKANEQVTVIAELDGWYQVEDPNTGMVGYMSTQFVVK